MSRSQSVPTEAPPREAASAVPAPSGSFHRSATSVSRRLPFVLILGVVLLGFGLRVYELGAQSIWGDEIYSHMYTQMGWIEILRFNIGMRDPQPPLYYYLLKVFVGVAGLSEFSLRYLSLIAGVSAIAAMYSLGRMLAGPAVGLTAAIILAVNPYHVWYAQESRTYTLTTLLALLSTLLFVRILRRDTNLATWIGYVGCSTLLVYSHYFGFLLLVFQNVAFFVLCRPRGLSWKRWLLAQSAFVVPYLPFAPHGVGMMATFWSANPSDLSWSFLETSLRRFSLGWFVEPNLAGVLLLGFVALLIVGILAPLWRGRWSALGQAGVGVNVVPAESERHPLRFQGHEQVLLLVGSIVIPVVAAVLALQVTNRVLLQDRYFILLTPSYYLLLALGINALRRIWVPLGGVALLFVLATGAASVHAYFTDPQYARYDVRGLAQHIFREGRPGDIVVVIEPIHDYFVYYYKGPLSVARIGRSTPEDVPAEIAPVAEEYRRIWLVPYADGDLDRAAEAWLDRHGFRLDARWFKTARVRLYSFPNVSRMVPGAADLPLEEGIRLERSLLGGSQVEAGQPAEVRLDWSGLPVDGAHRVIVRLLDSDGHAVAHNDRVLREGAFVDGETEVTSINLAVGVPYGTPPGSYQLVAGLRRPDGSDVALVDAQGRTLGTSIPLMPVEVVRPEPLLPLDRVEMAQRLDVALGGGIRLAGASLPEAQLQAGQPLEVLLFWQAEVDAPAALEVVGQLVDMQGRVISERRDSVAVGRYPPSQWVAGEVVRDLLELPTGRAGGDGTYQVRVTASAGGESRTVTLGSVRIAGRERRFDLPTFQTPIGQWFGEFASLVGLELGSSGQGEPRRLSPGQTLAVTLYWRAEGTTDTNYTVFVQLLDASGRLVAQHDGMPNGGQAPTSTWVEGEAIVDRHELAVPSDAAVGTYRLIAGLYDARDGQRLQLESGADFLELGTIEVTDASVP